MPHGKWLSAAENRADLEMPCRYGSACAAESLPHRPTLQPTSVMEYDDLRACLRWHLSQAMRDRDRVTTAVFRDAIAALDNAEAVDPGDQVVPQVSEHVAGGVVGLGAAEAERRLLDAETQRAIVQAEVEARLAAATTYEERGQSARGGQLRLEADVLLAVLETAAGRD
jgi:uncharacterized protein